jgi:hypothetical protein
VRSRILGYAFSELQFPLMTRIEFTLICADQIRPTEKTVLALKTSAKIRVTLNLRKSAGKKYYTSTGDQGIHVSVGKSLKEVRTIKSPRSHG